MSNEIHYAYGGTVQAGDGLYIPRKADRELLELCRAGTFAYVLTSRQVGKSSLMVRTAEQLSAEGIHTVTIDLTKIGVTTAAETWYLGILTEIATALRLRTDVQPWWTAHAHLSHVHRLVRFLQEVLLVEITGKVIIFFDEIDSTLRLDCAEDFYAALRSVYNDRATMPEFKRLAFVFLGVATPSDLIADKLRTPFNIGQAVDLTDFTIAEAEPLAQGLPLPPAEAKQVLRWILQWTGGHPYLTIRLCRAVTEQETPVRSAADVKQVVASIFFGENAKVDHNLQFVRDMLTFPSIRTPDIVDLLKTYRIILRERPAVQDDEQSRVKSHLKLAGVVCRDGKHLRVRNPIYKEVFNLRWIKEHWPVSWFRSIPREAWAIMILLVILLGVIFKYADQQQKSAQEQTRFGMAQRAFAEQEARARRQAEWAEQQAIEAQTKAENFGFVSLAQVLALEAQHRYDDLGALLAGQAYLFHKRGQGNVAPQIDDTLRTVLSVTYFGRTLYGHEDQVLAVAFDPRKQRLASGSSDGTVRLWKLQQSTESPHGETIYQGKGETVPAVLSLAFSPDGQQLALGSSDGTVRLLRVEQDNAADPIFHTSVGTARPPVQSVGFDRDGQWLAAGSRNGLVCLRDLRQAGEHDCDIRIPPGDKGATEDVWALAFSPDNRWLAVGSIAGKVSIWDWRHRPPRLHDQLDHQTPVLAMAFHPQDSQTLATGAEDGALRVWTLGQNTRERQPVVLRDHDDAVLAVAYSPDGQRLASGSGDHSVRLWWPHAPSDRIAGSASQTAALESRAYTIQAEPDGEYKVLVLRSHKGRANAIAFSPDHKWLAAGSGDHTVRLWQREALEKAPRTPYLAEQQVMDRSPDGQWRVVKELDQMRLKNSHSTEAMPPLQDHTAEVLLTAFSHNNEWLAVWTRSKHDSLRLWNLQQTEPKEIPLDGQDGERAVVIATFSPDNRWLATGSADGSIRLWELSQPAPQARRLLDRRKVQEGNKCHAQEVLTLVFSPDRHWLASGSQDNKLCLWRPGSQLESMPILLADHEGCGLSVAFSFDGQWLAAGSFDQKLRLWDMHMPMLPPYELNGHEGGVRAVVFSRHSPALISVSGDRTVWRWDLPSSPGKQPPHFVLLRYNSSIRHMALTGPDGQDRELVISDKINPVSRYNLMTTDDLSRLVCDHVWRNLTAEEWKQFVSDELPYECTCPALPIGEGVIGQQCSSHEKK
jgi:WD40 repeat protein